MACGCSCRHSARHDSDLAGGITRGCVGVALAEAGDTEAVFAAGFLQRVRILAHRLLGTLSRAGGLREGMKTAGRSRAGETWSYPLDPFSACGFWRYQSFFGRSLTARGSPGLIARLSKDLRTRSVSSIVDWLLPGGVAAVASSHARTRASRRVQLLWARKTRRRSCTAKRILCRSTSRRSMFYSVRRLQYLPDAWR
jgi:hypothetical protein